MSPAHTSLRKIRIDMIQGTLVLHVTAAALESACGRQWGACWREELTHECGGCRLIQPMLDELKALTAARAGHNAAMNVGAGVLGSRILQILEVTSAVVVPPPPKKSIFSRAVSPRSLARRASRAFAWPTACWLYECFLGIWQEIYAETSGLTFV